MKFTALTNRRAWERRLGIAWKEVLQPLRRPCYSKPVFVVGKQRSGTSMLMFVFHRHPHALVYDEHRDNRGFKGFRLRDLDHIRRLVANARYPVVLFKPLADSHRIAELHSEFPDGHLIWIYRNHLDVANSSLRKFPAATRAIRLICTGQPGGGWLQEGVSPPVAEVLRNVYRPDLSEFDLACLVWWARNQIILESGLMGNPNVTVLKYEALATQPGLMLEWLCHRIGIDYREKIGKIVSARSIGRHEAPPLDAEVERLCKATSTALEDAFRACGPPFADECVNSDSAHEPAATFVARR